MWKVQHMRLFKSLFLLSTLLLTNCSNFKRLDVISINIKANENYTRGFYDDLQKNEFMMFENKESIINYFRNGNYDTNSLSLSEIHDAFNDNLFHENYVALLNIVIGTSSTVKTEQDNNLIIYHIYDFNISTDGLVFTTLINPIKKNNNAVNEFKYIIKYENKRW